MCEVLYTVGDQTHPDPVYERIHCLKDGAVINVMEDGFPWGPIEFQADRAVARKPGIDVKVYRKAMNARMQPDNTAAIEQVLVFKALIMQGRHQKVVAPRQLRYNSTTGNLEGTL